MAAGKAPPQSHGVRVNFLKYAASWIELVEKEDYLDEKKKHDILHQRKKQAKSSLRMSLAL